jgi:prevent-host-death family protein
MSKQHATKSATTEVDDANVVGIRDLRDHLSAYLDRVKAGESLTITEHGKPIARIVGGALPPRLLEMIARGEATMAKRQLPDWSKIRPVKFDGDTQDLIDEIR